MPTYQPEPTIGPADPVQYDVNEMPPLIKAIPLAVQHVLAMFVGNATPPLIVAAAIGLVSNEVTLLLQCALLMSGVTTLIQTLGMGPVGARLPVMQGTSFAFVAVAIQIAENYGIGAVFGGALVAGVVQAFFGTSLRWLRPLFPPLVSGIVILVIGLKLMPTAINYSAGGVGAEDFGSLHYFAVAGLVVVVTVVISQFARGFFAIAAVLIGLVVGYLVALPLGMVDFSAVSEAGWFLAPTPLYFGLSFQGAAVMTICIVAVASSVESIGDLTAITRTGAGRDVTSKELSGGVIGDGVGTSLAALFGAMPNTTFSQNVGVIALTGVVSRFVVAIAGGLLIVAGFVPKLAALISTIPPAVLGGSTLIMFSMVAAAGIQVLSSERLDRRAMLILAVSLGIGLGFTFAPDTTTYFPNDVQLLLTSGIVPAMLTAVTLNLLLPKRQHKQPTRSAVHHLDE